MTIYNVRILGVSLFLSGEKTVKEQSEVTCRTMVAMHFTNILVGDTLAVLSGKSRQLGRIFRQFSVPDLSGTPALQCLFHVVRVI